MGTCVCKEQQSETDSTVSAHNGAAVRSVSAHVPANDYQDGYVAASSSGRCQQFPSSYVVDRLILDTLSLIRTFVDDMEPPPPLLQLHDIADREDGWIEVVISMVNVIPMNNPLGPAVITLLLDECPLPTKESVLRISEIFNLSAQSSLKGRSNPTCQRNICVVLGCIAEKLAGPSRISILTPGTLSYLITNLSTDNNPSVILFSVIALEKFAQTSENKVVIKKRLEAEPRNPLLCLEKWVNSKHYVKKQVGFCAQWCLDNLFLVEGRMFSYKCVDMSGINVMLNTKDVSEYLKISPDGLEARCDAYSFESVRCTFQVDSGVWYYETEIITPGVMQIGWATKDSMFLNHEGFGIGDDEFSVAYDGCRRLIWHNAGNEAQSQEGWCPGDILGCLLDLNNLEMMFYLNGVPVCPCIRIFKTARSGLFAAASFMSFQQCRFNFGNKPFRFPPLDREFQSFNDHAILSAEDKVVLPRHIHLEQLRQLTVCEDLCTLCFDERASMRLLPCGHKGFCSSCVLQLEVCPMCRASIQEYAPDNT